MGVGGSEFLEFSKKQKGSDFSHKKGGIGKIGAGCFKQGGYH